MKPLSVIIFSKDRAPQLDLCLTSMKKNLSVFNKVWNIEVIYKSSSEEFESGYSILKESWEKEGVTFVNESSDYIGGVKNLFQDVNKMGTNPFRISLESSMRRWGKFVLFFTDDDIAYREIKEDCFSEIEMRFTDKEFMCFSFRLGTNTFVQDQYRNTNCAIPDEVISQEQNIKKWNWKEQEKDTNFAYPFSLDGHMFKSEVAKQIIKNSRGYHNPNSLENKAQTYVEAGIFKQRLSNLLQKMPNDMGCFENSCIINTPVNRVQETFKNSAGVFFQQDAKSLNDSFIQGKRLDLDSMDFSTIIGTHQEIKLKWKNTTDNLK